MLLETLIGLLAAGVIIYTPLSLFTVANQTWKLEKVDKTLAFTSLMYGACFTMRFLLIA
jgi:hypothetical protein